MRLTPLNSGQDVQDREVMPAPVDAVEVAVEIEWRGDEVPVRVDVGAGPTRAGSFGATRQASSKSKCSVKITAGSPIRTASSQVRRIVSTAGETGPPVSHDHSLCT